MDEVFGHHDMFDSVHNCVGLKDINAELHKLAIDDVLYIEAEKSLAHLEGRVLP